MGAFKIMIPTDAECEELDARLMEHNANCVPFTQEDAYIRIGRCVRDEQGCMIAGIVAYSVMWRILYIDTLWVAKEHRRRGLGRSLLLEAERAGAQMGCTIAHLDSFDFQGVSFYENCGYERFGVLEDCPQGHSEHFFMKRLAGGGKQ